CPSSGYLWMVEKNDGLEVKREPLAAEGRMGGSLAVVFNVKAQTAGTYNIELVHMRPWEDNVHTRVRCVVNVAP
ncbi:MAG: protease inhibitor I42 family protein, partial [Alphaproteobacteria bacterium]|nr:protease inhibitor I42 family protein [Alphaproteobacteria bacterium]